MKAVIERKIGPNMYKALVENEYKYVSIEDELEPGDELTGEFVYKQDPFYGQVLVLSALQRYASNSYMKAMFTLTSIPGIGKVTAKKILDSLGDNAIQKILAQPEVLESVQGLRSNQRKAILHELRLLDMTECISRYIPDIQHRSCVTLAKYVVDNNIDGLVKQDPCYLTIYGDMVNPRYIKLVKDKDLYDMARIVYALQYEACNSKKTRLTVAELSTKLNLEPKRIEGLVSELEKKDIVLKNGEYISTLAILRAFGEIVSYLRKHMRLPRVAHMIEEIESDVNYILNSDYAQLNELQRAAVRSALTRHVSIITGGPGTGKSVTIQAIHDIGRRLGLDVLVVTPTGKAAQRLEQVGARTVHAAIAWDGKKSNRVIDCDLIVLDEASMIDIQVLAELIKASGETPLVLVGDANQLPPVGYGSPFHTMVQMREYGMHVTELAQGYRNNSDISQVAMNVLNANVSGFISALKTSNSVKVAQRDNVNDILNLLKNTYSKAYSAKGLSELYSSLMILSPYKSEKRSGLSTEVLNTELGYVLGFPQDRFCKDMKVVQTMNDYENMVMNGELGVIAWTNDHEVGVQFKDGQVVTYSILESQAMLDRAFALTVHKAQGSEAQTVWLVIEPGAYGIMSKQLLYTAITRAKDKLAFFALGDSLSVQQLHAIFNNEQDFVDSSMLQEVRT